MHPSPIPTFALSQLLPPSWLNLLPSRLSLPPSMCLPLIQVSFFFLPSSSALCPVPSVLFSALSFFFHPHFRSLCRWYVSLILLSILWALLLHFFPMLSILFTPSLSRSHYVVVCAPPLFRSSFSSQQSSSPPETIYVCLCSAAQLLQVCVFSTDRSCLSSPVWPT